MYMCLSNRFVASNEFENPIRLGKYMYMYVSDYLQTEKKFGDLFLIEKSNWVDPEIKRRLSEKSYERTGEKGLSLGYYASDPQTQTQTQTQTRYLSLF